MSGSALKIVETAKLVQTLEEFRDVLMKSHHEDIVAGIKVPAELKSHDEPVPYEHPHRELASNFVTEVHRRNKFEGARMSEKYLGIGEGGKALHNNALPPHKRIKYADMQDPAPAAPAVKKGDYGSHGVHTSGGFSGLEAEGRSQAGNEITSRAPKAGNVYLKDMHHERGKEMHRKVLNALRSMKKPNLPKSEMDKAMTVSPAQVSSPLVINNAAATMTEPKIIDSPNVLNPYGTIINSMKNRPKR